MEEPLAGVLSRPLPAASCPREAAAGLSVPSRAPSSAALRLWDGASSATSVEPTRGAFASTGARGRGCAGTRNLACSNLFGSSGDVGAGRGFGAAVVALAGREAGVSAAWGAMAAEPPDVPSAATVAAGIGRGQQAMAVTATVATIRRARAAIPARRMMGNSDGPRFLCMA